MLVDKIEKIECLAGYKLENGVKNWLICNGMMMGRFTSLFSVPCLADNFDCKAFLNNRKELSPELTIVKFMIVQADMIEN